VTGVIYRLAKSQLESEKVAKAGDRFLRAGKCQKRVKEDDIGIQEREGNKEGIGERVEKRESEKVRERGLRECRREIESVEKRGIQRK
jgi:hypothetical protein